MHNRKQMGDCIVLAMVDWIVCILIGHWQTWSMITIQGYGKTRCCNVLIFRYLSTLSLYIPQNISNDATIVEKGIKM